MRADDPDEITPHFTHRSRSRSTNKKFAERTCIYTYMLSMMIPISLALSLAPTNVLSRRKVVTSAVAAAAGTVAAARPANADSVSDMLYGKPSSGGGSRASAVGPEIFVGEYTDPVHPGGTRKITLQGTKLGPFQLAKIVGGGGVGEPALYELPAMVSPAPGQKDGWQITIDFSPKGGPKDVSMQRAKPRIRN